MAYIDSHVHLDSWKFPNIQDAAGELNQQLIDADFEKAIVLHLEIQNWSVEAMSKVITDFDRIEAFVNVHPTNPKAAEILTKAIREQFFCGLKLHPRLQKFQPDEPEVIELCRHAGTLNIPVLLDAFPDGTGLMQGFSPLAYAALAKACPNTRFIWAHMGGHHVIDFMMLAKRLENVHFDCSYSLLYFRGSSIPQNMVYAMRSMRFERVFYGSDFPDRTIKESLNASIEVLDEFGVNDTQKERLLYGNFKEFMSW